MNKEDMILISVDDHIVEPPDMFKNHLPKKYIDDAPRLVHNPDGSAMWQFLDTVIPNVALNAVAGRPKKEYGLEPQGLDEIRPGCYRVDERVKDMNTGGAPCLAIVADQRRTRITFGGLSRPVRPLCVR